MLILTVRTDAPEAEVGLYEDQTRLTHDVWQAHRELGRSIHDRIAGILKLSGKDWDDIGGVVAYEGPGSFTGLRIGLTVANAIAYGRPCPVVASGGEDWIGVGISRLMNGEDDVQAVPAYGSEANITLPKK